jgi:hypothetical protein
VEHRDADVHACMPLAVLSTTLHCVVTCACPAAGGVAAGDARLLLQMCEFATANYAQLQADNQHAAACLKEVRHACALLQDVKEPSQRLVTWTLQVLLANAQRLGKIITHDSSRCLFLH